MCADLSLEEESAKMEYLGIDPSTSRMLSERSTIWASTPLKLNLQFLLIEEQIDWTMVLRKKTVQVGSSPIR